MTSSARLSVLVGVTLALVLTRAGAAAAGGGAAHRRVASGRDCAECHQGRVQATHDSAFVETTHGAAAVADRPQCLGCHRREQCRDCHARQAPSWHTAALCDPGRDMEARREHARIGLERRAGCFECHAERFIRQCAECHRSEELPR